MERVVQPTSVEAFERIAPTLPKRQRKVLEALGEYFKAWTAWPTAYELERAMVREGKAFDLNSVRPRLTELHKLGLVIVPGKRPCRITGQRAMVWQVVYPERLF